MVVKVTKSISKVAIEAEDCFKNCEGFFLIASSLCKSLVGNKGVVSLCTLIDEKNRLRYH
jgi:hypothetical protein